MKTITQSVADASPNRSRSRLLSLYRTEIAIAIAIIVMELAVGFIVPAALSVGNVSNVAQASAPLVIMAFGVLLVVITGGIDLSVGSVFSLTGMVTGLAMAHGFSAVASCAAGLSIGLLIGAINGALVTYVGLAPFVVTLSTYAIAGSLSFIVTDGHSLPISDPNFCCWTPARSFQACRTTCFGAPCCWSLLNSVCASSLPAAGSMQSAAAALRRVSSEFRSTGYAWRRMYCQACSRRFPEWSASPTSGTPKRQQDRASCSRRSPQSSSVAPVSLAAQARLSARCWAR
jgi:hypothetical protein